MAKQSRQIVLPVRPQAYAMLIDEPQAYRAWLDQMQECYPELFPAQVRNGYTLHDMRGSQKMPEVKVRWIQAQEADENGKRPTWTVWPSYMLSYMTGHTGEVADALFLSSFGVPCWALTMVFGRDDMYWQRQIERLGHYDLVGTTVRAPANLPDHLVADEKHTRLCGQAAYIAMTVGRECVLGVSLSVKADAKRL